MNKTVKVVSILLITILLIAALSQACFASSTYTEIITGVDQNATGKANNIDGISKVASNVIKLIRNIAAIAAVVIISILGIKYMMGSTEERAEYKKSFIPLIVGIVVVVAASSIASLLFGLM